MSECIDAVSLMLGTSGGAATLAIATTVKREKEECPSCGLYFADKEEAKSHWAMAHCEAADYLNDIKPRLLSHEDATTSRELSSLAEDTLRSVGQASDSTIASSTPFRPPKFNCGDCKEAFPTLGFLFRHLQLVHGRITPEIFECHTCGDAFTKLGYRDRHVRKCRPLAIFKASSAVTDAQVGVKRRRGRPPGSKSKTKINFNDSRKNSSSTLPSSSSLAKAAAPHGGKVLCLQAIVPSASLPIAIQPPASHPLEMTSTRLIRRQSATIAAPSSTIATALSELLPSAPLRSAGNSSAEISTSTSLDSSDFCNRPVSPPVIRPKPRPIKSDYWRKTSVNPLRKCNLHKYFL